MNQLDAHPSNESVRDLSHMKIYFNPSDDIIKGYNLRHSNDIVIFLSAAVLT